TCQAGVFGACMGPPPGVEVCNEADDDCDGQVDEDVTNACGGCGPAPVEACNGDDDDCDGAVDEGVLNACGACGPPPDEVCNAADDDCDGAIDEGVANACGGCGAPPAETCDGTDEDCDDTVDEGLQQACASACGAGTEICMAGQWVDCDAPTPVPEVCGGGDDDCDGAVDEQVPGEPLCVARPNSEGECRAGQCQYTCEPLFFDVDNQAANGCEHGCGEPAAGVVVPDDRALDVALHHATDGTRGVLLARGGELTLVLPNDAITIELANAWGGADRASVQLDAPSLTWAGGRWIAAARYAVTREGSVPPRIAEGVAVFSVTALGGVTQRALATPEPGPPVAVADPGPAGPRVSVAFTHTGDGAEGGLARSIALFRSTPGGLAQGVVTAVGNRDDYRETRIAAVITEGGLGIAASWINALGVQAGLRFLGVGETPAQPNEAEWSTLTGLNPPPGDVAAVATGRNVYVMATGPVLRFGVVGAGGRGFDLEITETIAQSRLRPVMGLGPHGPVGFAVGRVAGTDACLRYVIDPGDGALLGSSTGAVAPADGVCEQAAVSVAPGGEMWMA
ncbi:MAG: hypothetical protein KC583_17950, partial [Myxococcales bacterium]|nr:hypothetical protein [Myxococcales bacterium]